MSRRPQSSITVSAMAHAAVEPPKYIDGFRIKQFLKYEDLIPVIEEALLNFSARESGGIVQPVRSSVAVEDRGYVCNYSFVLSISYSVLQMLLLVTFLFI